MSDIEAIIKMTEFSIRHSVGPCRTAWPPDAKQVLRLWDRNRHPLGIWYFDKDGKFIIAVSEEQAG
jgi:hypothetical protein